MKKLLTTTFLAVSLFATSAFAGIPVTCINCSNFVRQAIDSITMANELETAINSYQEFIVQTEKQIYMAQMEAQRLLELPADLKDNKYSQHMMNLTKTLDQLKMYKGDMAALADIQRQVYPDLNEIYGVTADNPNGVQELWQKQMENSDKLYAAALGVSAEQLDAMSKSDAARKNRIENLVKQKNETQIQQAANQLTGIMLNDVNELKTLAAVSLQQDADKNLREQKQAEMEKAMWENANKTPNWNLNEVKTRF